MSERATHQRAEGRGTKEKRTKGAVATAGLIPHLLPREPVRSRSFHPFREFGLLSHMSDSQDLAPRDSRLKGVYCSLYSVLRLTTERS